MNRWPMHVGAVFMVVSIGLSLIFGRTYPTVALLGIAIGWSARGVVESYRRVRVVRRRLQ